MKTYLPHFMRKIGIAIFIISIIISFIGSVDHFMSGFVSSYDKYDDITVKYEDDMQAWKIINNGLIFSEEEQKQLSYIALICSISGLLVYVLSKERIEDEFLSQLRANSLIKAVAFSWLFYFILKPLNFFGDFEALSVLQLQFIIYIVVYAYTRKIKYAE